MATANDVTRTLRQRNVAIHHPDFENFDNEMSVEDYDYYTKHKEEFKQMWHDQTLLYWKRLNLNYKAFLVDYGTVYKLRASGPLMNMLLKECWGYLDRQTTKSNDVELVMKLIEDGYILVKSRHLLPFVDVRDKEKCPFLNESTKKTFRRFFGTPKKMGLRLKVWFQYPLYVKYTGALCKFLKNWIKTTEYIEEDTGNYWKLPVKRVLDSYDLDYSVLIGKETKPPWVHPDPNSNMWWDNGGLSTMMFLSPEGPKILARYLDLHIPEYMDKKELEEHKKEQERKAEARRQEEMNIIEFALKKEAQKNKLEKKMEELLVSKVPMPEVSPEKLGRKKPTLPEAVKSKSMQVFKLQKVRRDGYESNEDEDMEDPEQFYKKYEIKAELVDKEPEGEEANTPIGLYMDAAAIRKQQSKLDAESDVKKEMVEDDDEGEVSEERMTYSLLKAQLSKTGAIPKETSNENESQKEKTDCQIVKGNKLKVNGKKPIKIEIDSITNQNARARKNKKITGAAGDSTDEKKVHNVTINLPGEGGSQRQVLVTIDGDQPKKSVSGMIWNAPIFKELSFAQKLLSKPEDDDDDPHFMVAKKIMGKKEIDYTKDSELEIGSRHLHVLSYQSRLKVVPELRKLINPEEEKMRNKQYRRSMDALKGYGITAVQLPHGHVLSSSGWRCDLFMTDDCLDGLVLVKNTKNFGYKYGHKVKSKGRKQRAKAPKNMKKVIREEKIKQKKEEHLKGVRLKQEIMRKTWEEEKAVPERRYHSKDNPGADESPFMMYKSLLWDVVAGDVRAIRNMIIVLNDTRNDDVNLNALSKEQRQQVEEDKELIGVVVKKITEYKDKQPFVIFPPGMDQMVDIYHAVIMAKMLRESLREQYTVDTVHTPPDRQVVLDTFAQMVPHLAEEVKFEYVQKVKKYYEGKDKYKAFIERKIIQEAERRVQIEGRERGEHVTVEDRMQYTKRPEFQELVYEKLLEGYKNRGESGKKRHAKDEKETSRETHARSDEKEYTDQKSSAEDNHDAWTRKGSLLTENTMAQVENDVKLFLDKDSPSVPTPEVHSNPTASKKERKESDNKKWAFVRENEATDNVRKSTDAEMMEEVDFTESKKETNGDVIKQKKPYEFKTCSYCDKVETIRKQFKQCQRCVQMKTKRIRFYCTKECQVNDWKLKHKEQHSTGNFN